MLLEWRRPKAQTFFQSRVFALRMRGPRNTTPFSPVSVPFGNPSPVSTTPVPVNIVVNAVAYVQASSDFFLRILDGSEMDLRQLRYTAVSVSLFALIDDAHRYRPLALDDSPASTKRCCRVEENKHGISQPLVKATVAEQVYNSSIEIDDFIPTENPSVTVEVPTIWILLVSFIFLLQIIRSILTETFLWTRSLIRLIKLNDGISLLAVHVDAEFILANIVSRCLAVLICSVGSLLPRRRSPEPIFRKGILYLDPI